MVEDEVRAYIKKLDICKSIGPSGKYPGLPRMLDDAVARPLDNLGFIMVPGDWRQVNITPRFKKSRRRRRRTEELVASHPHLQPCDG